MHSASADSPELGTQLGVCVKAGVCPIAFAFVCSAGVLAYMVLHSLSRWQLLLPFRGYDVSRSRFRQVYGLQYGSGCSVGAGAVWERVQCGSGCKENYVVHSIKG